MKQYKPGESFVIDQLKQRMNQLPLLKNDLTNKDLDNPIHLKYTILTLADEIIRLRKERQ